MAKKLSTDLTVTAADDGPAEGGRPLDTLATQATEVVDGAAQLARGLPAGVDRAAATTGRAVVEAQRTVQKGSDAALFGGASLAAGLAMGLLVGGAPRIVAGLAILPAAVLGMTLADRRSGRLDRDGNLLN